MTMTRIFDQIQLYLLSVLVLVAPTTIRRVVWEVAAVHQEIYVDFRGIQVFLFDFPMAVLWAVMLLRLVVDGGWRGAFVGRLSGVAGGRGWLLLVGWMAVSGLWATYPTLTAYVVVRWLAALGVALVVADLVARGYFAEVVWALLLSALVQSGVALGQWVTDGNIGLAALGEVQMFARRPVGLTVNPNNLAGFLLLALGCGVWLRLITPPYLPFVGAVTGPETKKETVTGAEPPPVDEPSVSRWQLLPSVLVLVVIGVALVAASSRAALLGCVLVIAFALLRRRITLKRLLVVMGLLVLLVAVTYRPDRNLSGYWDRAFAESDDALALVQAQPIAGVGAGNLMVRIDALRADDERQLRLPAHNTLLVVWAELGLVSLVIIILTIVDMLRRSVYPILLWLILLAPPLFFDYYFWLDYRTHVVVMVVLGMIWGRIAHSSDTRGSS